MNIQDIFQTNQEAIYGITVNKDQDVTDYLTPPPQVKELGFILSLDEDNLINENLLDVLINYNFSTGINITLEVPSHLLADGSIDIKYLMQLSSNINFSISLLPPKHPLVDPNFTQEQYREAIKSATLAICHQPNFDKEIIPITSYFHYMALSLLGKGKGIIDNFTPDNDYIINNYKNIMTTEDSDQFKGDIKETIYDFYGGEDVFKATTYLIFKNIQNEIKDITKDHIYNKYIEGKENTNSAEQQPPL